MHDECRTQCGLRFQVGGPLHPPWRATLSPTQPGAGPEDPGPTAPAEPAAAAVLSTPPHPVAPSAAAVQGIPQHPQTEGGATPPGNLHPDRSHAAAGVMDEGRAPALGDWAPSLHAVTATAGRPHHPHAGGSSGSGGHGSGGAGAQGLAPPGQEEAPAPGASAGGWAGGPRSSASTGTGGAPQTGASVRAEGGPQGALGCWMVRIVGALQAWAAWSKRVLRARLRVSDPSRPGSRPALWERATVQREATHLLHQGGPACTHKCAHMNTRTRLRVCTYAYTPLHAYAHAHAHTHTHTHTSAHRHTHIHAHAHPQT